VINATKQPEKLLVTVDDMIPPDIEPAMLAQAYITKQASFNLLVCFYTYMLNLPDIKQ
jgi:hypothetical protein